MDEKNIDNLPTVEKEIEDLKEINSTLLLCINTLYDNDDIKKAINSLLEIIAEYHGADRAYIFEFSDDSKHVDNTYEWCANGITAQIKNLKNVPLKAVSRWIEPFEKNGEVFVFSVSDDLSHETLEYNILNRQQISSLMEVPFYDHGKLVGFLGVDNPTRHKETTVLMKSVATFVLNDIRRRETTQKLYELSFTDSLTGLKNRNAYVETLKNLEKTKPEVGIIFADINGLKSTNDSFGHEKGDELISASADALKRTFKGCKNSQIYRIGGDEFVVFCKNMSKPKFESLTAQLRSEQKKIRPDCDMNLSVGAVYLEEKNTSPGGREIEKAVSRADELMYSEKKKYHMTRQK